MKKLVGFIILLIAAGGGWWYWVKFGTPEEPATVNKATISRGPITEAVKSTGALEPTRRYDVGSQVSGVVKAIHVDYNDIVKKDQLMAEIDPSLLQVQVDIQKANVERAVSDIENQEVQLEDQKKQFERTKSLFERSLINQQAYETAELAIKTRESQIASSKKSLVSARAQLNSAELNVSYTKIKAPADGVVVTRSVDVGQTVQASMTSPSFFIMNQPLDKLKLTANVDEAEIGKIRSGMRVEFVVDSYGPTKFYGEVEAVRLGATNQNNVVTYPVWITVPNEDLRLRPFMTATLSIIISRADDVVRVPLSATRFRPSSDMYKALGITPPAVGGRIGGTPETNATPGAGGDARGGQTARGGGQAAQPGGQAAPQNGQTAQPGRNASAQPGGGNTQRQPGQGGQGAQAGQNRGGGNAGGNAAGTGGRGMNSAFANMTPEEQKQAMARFTQPGGGRTGGGGRGNTGAGGRGGTNNQGGRGGQAGRGARPVAPPVDMNSANRIDELWAPIVPVETRGSVWKYNPAAPPEERLKQISVRMGISDGSFMALLSGDLNVGDEVVTGIILPLSMRPAATNPLMGGQQQRGGQTGMPTMGAPGGGGGGGNPGGGGAGGRGGGGGGGRGGN